MSETAGNSEQGIQNQVQKEGNWNRPMDRGTKLTSRLVCGALVAVMLAGCGGVPAGAVGFSGAPAAIAADGTQSGEVSRLEQPAGAIDATETAEIYPTPRPLVLPPLERQVERATEEAVAEPAAALEEDAADGAGWVADGGGIAAGNAEAGGTPAVRTGSGYAAREAVATGAMAEPVAQIERIEDVDPAPPLTALVDVVRLVEGRTYQVTGHLRNDGDEAYEGVGIEATFYDGSQWHFGPFDAVVGCYQLAPGERCPFSVEAYARDYQGYRLHTIGHPLKAWTGSSTHLTVAGVEMADQAAGYVRLTGVVRNDTASIVDTVRVSGALLDARGQIVGLNTAILGGAMTPGGEIAFSVSVPAAAYASFEVAAEGQLR